MPLFMSLGKYQLSGCDATVPLYVSLYANKDGQLITSLFNGQYSNQVEAANQGAEADFTYVQMWTISRTNDYRYFTSSIVSDDPSFKGGLPRNYLYKSGIYDILFLQQLEEHPWLHPNCFYNISSTSLRYHPNLMNGKEILQDDKNIVGQFEFTTDTALANHFHGSWLFSNNSKYDLPPLPELVTYQFSTTQNELGFELFTYEPSQHVPPQMKECESLSKGQGILLLGDSHTLKTIHNFFPFKGGEIIFKEFTGVFYNTAADDYKKWISSPNSTAVWIPRGYEDLQRNMVTSKLKIIVISFGQWGLRDLSSQTYLKRVRRLIVEVLLSFRERGEGRRVIFVGTPAWSYHKSNTGPMELRSNAKIAFVEEQLAHMCQEFDLEFVPNFKISFPLWFLPSDTHHYVNMIGEITVKMLVETICAK